MPDPENRRKSFAYSDEPGAITPAKKSLREQAMVMALAPEATEAAAPPAAPQGKISLPAWMTLIGGNAADVLSTRYALQNNPNAREGNPLLGKNPGTGRLLATKAAGVGIQALLMKLLENQGKDGVAEALGYGSGALGAGLAIHNTKMGKQEKP